RARQPAGSANLGGGAALKITRHPATVAVAGLTLAAFALRLAYAVNSHPFIDEFTTALAARTILRRGLPILPSGLFYEHGLLFSYLDAPFIALTGAGNLFILARLPSLLFGTAAVPLLYRVGRRWFSAPVGLLAAALLAFSPEGMVWGGRARMYALAQLLILRAAFFAFEGSARDKPRLRWLALLALLLALLNHFGTMLFVPPLVVGVVSLKFNVQRLKFKAGGLRHYALRSKIWLAQAAALAAIIAVAVLVKRLGQPLGMVQLGGGGGGNPLPEMWNAVAYQIGLALDGESAVKFLARQFGVPHHLWLTIVAVAGVIVQSLKFKVQGSKFRGAYLFLWLVFGLAIGEMITLLEPFRRNPRYVVMGLPLFYLLAAEGFRRLTHYAPRATRHARRFLPWTLGLGLFLLQARGLWLDGNIAYRTPEPPYDRAFQLVAQQWRPGDVTLTMNTSAAALYLPRVDYFAVQRDAEQFLLNVPAEPVDRWLGLPWLGTTAGFNRTLNEHPRVWFVIDRQRLTGFGFYGGNWLALLNSQMEEVWAEEGALVFRTRPDRVPIPAAPAAPLNAQFGGAIRLDGYTLDNAPSSPRLSSFWTALAPVEAEYTLFVHLRNAANDTVAQWDRQP
ncbi:MAG: ArnT family glycosyltransferase, partial [Anaerolineae bacterium]